MTYGHRWKLYSRQYRQEHPLCRPCELRHLLTPAQAVDHIRPHKGDYLLFWDNRNLQPICKKCHDIKSSRESRGMIVTWKPRTNAWVICGKPGSGKSTFARSTGAEVWDMDEVARKLGYMPDYPRPKMQIDDLLRRRREFMMASKGKSVAIIVTYVAPAFDIAKELQAQLIHCWM